MQVAVFAAEKDDASTAYRQSIIAGFQGGDTGYLAGAPDTGVPVREFFGEPSEAPEALLGGALHTLGIVLVSRALVENESMLHWLGRLADKIDAADRATPDKHKLLVIDLDSALDGFLQKTGTDAWPQATTAEQLGERAVRPSKASLNALNLSLQALCSETTLLESKFRVFVSHAKLDGQPLADAVSRMIKKELRFDGFYDAEDIPVGSSWRRVLQQGVRDSIVIVLRSGAYEDRPWCRQEMLWAEEFASPVIVVDLRSRQIEPA
ncbi:MAG: toll/interleukin-1 receptor domain-containing protein, partial [Pseudomonadota bacterium]